MKRYLPAIMALAAVLSACGPDGFVVSGTVEGGADTVKMVLEESGNGRWLIIDTVTTRGEGTFETSQPAPQWSNIYRLRWNGKCIYFPIDSIEHINVETSVEAFGSDFKLSGSEAALQTMAIDKRAAELGTLSAEDYVIQSDLYKRELANQILGDPSGIVAYYAINKYIGDRPLYDPVNDFDFKIIGAVANAFNTFRSNDPRTTYLVNELKRGLVERRRMEISDTIYIEESNLIEIKLYNNFGVEYSLAEVAQHGDVVILTFSIYAADFSPAFNRALADIYNKYSSRGVEIFSVGLDDDSYAWQQAVENLPWITVYDPLGTSSNNIATYNVFSVPMSYIINREGEIVERVTDYTQLEAVVKKYL